MWANAASATSRGALEHSPHQSLKLERKPCGTAAIRSPRSSVESVLPDNERPSDDGKARPPPGPHGASVHSAGHLRRLDESPVPAIGR